MKQRVEVWFHLLLSLSVGAIGNVTVLLRSMNEPARAGMRCARSGASGEGGAITPLYCPPRHSASRVRRFPLDATTRLLGQQRHDS
jgi:hypothetical protein